MKGGAISPIRIDAVRLSRVRRTPASSGIDGAVASFGPEPADCADRGRVGIHVTCVQWRLRLIRDRVAVAPRVRARKAIARRGIDHHDGGAAPKTQTATPGARRAPTPPLPFPTHAA